MRRTISRGSGGTFEFGQPKAKHGRRQVALPLSVANSLRRHLAHQFDERIDAGTTYVDQGLVFADALGAPLHPNTVTWQFKELIARAHVPPIRFHDLRHTSATLMLANGEHPKIVSERLGHANISITLDRYSHVTPQMQAEAAARLDALVGQGPVASPSTRV